MDNVGYIKLQTFIANQGLPVKNVMGKVFILNEGIRTQIATLITDENGDSDVVSLPTNSYIESQQPSDQLPYSVYDLEISKDEEGYKTYKWYDKRENILVIEFDKKERVSFVNEVTIDM